MPDIGTNSSMTQKVWRAGLSHEAERQCFAMEFVSPDEDSPFVLMEDLTRNRGDKVRFKFSPTVDTTDGFGDLDQVEGNEEELEIVESELSIDRLKLAYKQRGIMSQQRTNVDLKKAALVKLANRWARRFEESIFNQLIGFTPANYMADSSSENSVSGGTNYKRTGMNAVYQFDSNHVYTHASETVLEDQNLDSNDVITLTIIDSALEAMQSSTRYPIAPCSDGFYHMFISPRQFTTLKSTTSTGQWMDIQRAILEGGAGYSNSAFKRYFAGIYSNVKIHITNYVKGKGVHSSNAYDAIPEVDRAVIVGANALRIAFGEGYASDDHLDWTEQVRNYDNWGVMADTVWGCSRVRYNLPNSSSLETYGAYLIPTYEG